MTESGRKLAALAFAATVAMAVLSGGATFAVLNDAERLSVTFSAGNVAAGNMGNGGGGSSGNAGNTMGGNSIAPVLFSGPGEFEMWTGVRTVRRRERREE